MKTNYQYKNIDAAKKRQKERLENRIRQLISTCKDAYFLTFTFNDKTLENTTAQTRLRAIKKYLNEQASEYVLNCDYGATFGREHYHAIIKPKHKILILSNYKYGYLEAKKLFVLKRYNIKDANRLAIDLAKHATKWTTEHSRIIYSRTQKKHYRFKYKKQADAILNKYKESTQAKEQLNLIYKIRELKNQRP